MKAYELADQLQMDKAKALLYVDTVVQSADLLRQQADRIAELEKFNKAILKKGGYPYEKSNPVAWMSPDGKVSTTEGILFHIPLYTTPQTKPLSDEEIMDIAERSDYSPVEIEMGYDYEIRIARAIEERHGIK